MAGQHGRTMGKAAEADSFAAYWRAKQGRVQPGGVEQYDHDKTPTKNETPKVQHRTFWLPP